MELFNRTELKYLISIPQYLALKQDLESLLVRDKHSENGFYNVYSIYFDTPDLRFYFDKVDGFENRFKYRIRFYNSSKKLEKNDSLFLEIKEKRNNNIYKKRIPVTVEMANELIKRKDFQTHNDLASEFSGMTKEVLRPTVQTNYKREAFFSKGNSRLRITFDYQNNSYFYNQLANKMLTVPRYFFKPNMGILEIKAFDSLPNWLLNRIHFYGIKLEKVSKYCLGIESWRNEISTLNGVKNV